MKKKFHEILTKHGQYVLGIGSDCLLVINTHLLIEHVELSSFHAADVPMAVDRVVAVTWLDQSLTLWDRPVLKYLSYVYRR